MWTSTEVIVYCLYCIVQWCYTKKNCGPTSWKGQCRSKRAQSPINIVKRDAKISSTNTTFFFNAQYLRTQRSFYLQNNGHTVQMTFESKPSLKLRIEYDTSNVYQCTA